MSWYSKSEFYFFEGKNQFLSDEYGDNLCQNWKGNENSDTFVDLGPATLYSVSGFSVCPLKNLETAENCWPLIYISSSEVSQYVRTAK